MSPARPVPQSLTLVCRLQTQYPDRSLAPRTIMITSALSRLAHRTALAGLILWGNAAAAQQQAITGAASRTALAKSQAVEVVSNAGAGVIELGSPATDILESLDNASHTGGARQ